MAGERQLPRRGEDAQPRAVPRIGRREHKDGLGMAELARDRLHGVPLEPLRLEHHRERIAGKAPVGEHVERREPSAHESLLCAPHDSAMRRDFAQAAHSTLTPQSGERVSESAAPALSKPLDQAGVDEQPVEAACLGAAGAGVEQSLAAFQDPFLLGE